VVAAVAAVVAVRRSFFHGRFLGADELSDEQDYRRCRRRLH
jgi:hypothetical protein